MSAKESYQEKSTASVKDVAWIANAWRDSYFQGLDVAIKTQEEMERTAKEALAQGFSVQREGIKWYKQCADSLTTNTGTIAGMPNPLSVWTKQALDTANGTAETALKASEEAVKSGLAFYETAIAAPARKQAKELSARLFEMVVPD